MSNVKQWTVQRPRWAVLLGFAIYCGAVASLGYCLSAVYSLSVVIALMVCSLLWRIWHIRRLYLQPSNGLLSIDNAGRWNYSVGLLNRPLSLGHAWPGFAWVTLRFSELAATNSKDSMLELTIWKSSVTPEAWRQLCVCIAGQVTLPQQSSPEVP